MSIKKTNRYLILKKAERSAPLLPKAGVAPKDLFTRRECTGEEVLAILQELDDAEGYEIYELKGAPLVLQTTVVVARVAETSAADDLKDFPDQNGGE